MNNEVSFDETNDEHDVVRRHNRVLRRIVSILRKRVRHGDERTDEIFTALCDTNPSAEVAMRELWENTAQVYDPQDYDSVVKEYIATKKVIDAIQSQLAVLSNDKTSGTSLYVVSIPVKVDYQDGNFETTFVGPMSIRPDA